MAADVVGEEAEPVVAGEHSQVQDRHEDRDRTGGQVAFGGEVGGQPGCRAPVAEQREGRHQGAEQGRAAQVGAEDIAHGDDLAGVGGLVRRPPRGFGEEDQNYDDGQYDRGARHEEHQSPVRQEPA